MLVISRQTRQTILIGEAIHITVENIAVDEATLKLSAPADVIHNVSGSIKERRTNAAIVAVCEDSSLVLPGVFSVRPIDFRGDRVRLAIDVEYDLPVYRQEVYDAMQRENRDSD